MTAQSAQQPVANVARINRAHPLARGMTVALLPSGAGAVGMLINLADLTNNFAQNNATFVIGGGFYGRHVNKNANGFNQTHSVYRPADGYTYNSGVIVLNSCAGTGANAVNAGLVGFQGAGAGLYTDASAKLTLRMAATVVATGATTISTGPSVVGWSSATGDYHVYVNGKEDTASSSASTFGVQGVIDRLGTYNGGSVQGQYAWALILQWNRIIGAAEHAQIARAPFCMFTTSPMRRFANIAAAVTFNAAWNAAANSIISTGARAQ